MVMYFSFACSKHMDFLKNNWFKVFVFFMIVICESRDSIWAWNESSFIRESTPDCVFFFLMLTSRLSLTRRLWTWRLSVPQTGSQGKDVDEDVLAERQRVDSGAAASDLLQVSQLTKIYRHLNRRVQAVNKLSFSIPAGEVSADLRTFYSHFSSHFTLPYKNRLCLHKVYNDMFITAHLFII